MTVCHAVHGLVRSYISCNSLRFPSNLPFLTLIDPDHSTALVVVMHWHMTGAAHALRIRSRLLPNSFSTSSSLFHLDVQRHSIVCFCHAIYVAKGYFANL